MAHHPRPHTPPPGQRSAFSLAPQFAPAPPSAAPLIESLGPAHHAAAAADGQSCGGEGGNENTSPAATVGLLAADRSVNLGYVHETRVPRRCLTWPTEGVRNGGADNVEYDLVVRADDVLEDPADGAGATGSGYQVLDLLGKGTFGQVLRCLHLKTASVVAVKIVKNEAAYNNQAWVEINILRMLQNLMSEDERRFIVEYKGHFVFKGHMCIVLEKLSLNLYEWLRQNAHVGVSMSTLSSLLGQLLKALTVLAKANVVHCDLKLENILLTGLDTSEIKLIDFGSACQQQQQVCSYVQSRYYRSPEVLLCTSKYDGKIDLWSLGCVAGELFLGTPLFPGSDTFNMLERIQEMLGPFPASFLRRCRHTQKFFNVDGGDDGALAASGAPFYAFRLKSVAEYKVENDVRLPEWRRYIPHLRLEDLIMDLSPRMPAAAAALRAASNVAAAAEAASTPTSCSEDIVVVAQPSAFLAAETAAAAREAADREFALERAQRACFLELLAGLLKIDPVERYTPAEALAHPFVAGPFVPSTPHKGPAGVSGGGPAGAQPWPCGGAGGFVAAGTGGGGMPIQATDSLGKGDGGRGGMVAGDGVGGGSGGFHRGSARNAFRGDGGGGYSDQPASAIPVLSPPACDGYGSGTFVGASFGGSGASLFLHSSAPTVDVQRAELPTPFASEGATHYNTGDYRQHHHAGQNHPPYSHYHHQPQQPHQQHQQHPTAALSVPAAGSKRLRGTFENQQAASLAVSKPRTDTNMFVGWRDAKDSPVPRPGSAHQRHPSVAPSIPVPGSKRLRETFKKRQAAPQVGSESHSDTNVLGCWKNEEDAPVPSPEDAPVPSPEDAPVPSPEDAPVPCPGPAPPLLQAWPSSPRSMSISAIAPLFNNESTPGLQRSTLNSSPPLQAQHQPPPPPGGSGAR